MTQQPDVSQWQQAVEAEKQSLDKMKVFEYCAKPPKTPIKSKWVFKKKLNSDGTLERYKARLVAKGNIKWLETTTFRCEDSLPLW